MKILSKNTLAALAVVVVAATGAGNATASELKVEKQEWTFAGPFGYFDDAQLQRGFQIYKEVCSACHGLSRVAFRNLGDKGALGYSKDQIKALAAEYEVTDAQPDEEGEMFERTAKPFDYFPSPFANDNAARASNSGALPPDLSLMAKSRAVGRGFPLFIVDAFTMYQEHGPDYLYGLLTGYESDEPNDDGKYISHGYLGKDGIIAMAPPLADETVEYTDGTPATLEQHSKDVISFLMWTAEPKLEERKQLGFKVILFLILFAGLLYLTKRKVWANIEH